MAKNSNVIWHNVSYLNLIPWVILFRNKDLHGLGKPKYMREFLNYDSWTDKVMEFNKSFQSKISII